MLNTHVQERSVIDDPTRERIATRIVLAGGAVLGLLMAAHLALDAATHAAPWTNNDTAFFTYIGEQMRSGARLYVDWQDNDPPSVFWITLTAARLSELLHLPNLLVYNLFTLFCATIGLLVLVHSVRHMDRRWPAIALASAGYLFFVATPGFTIRDFGQREHLFALLLIPEIFALVAGAQFRGRPIWCAALGFMAMMKPQFAATVAIIALVQWHRSHWRKGELVGLVFGGLTPFALLWWHSPASVGALFSDTLQVHLSGGYALLNRSPRLLLARRPVLIGMGALCAFGATATVARKDSTARGLAVCGVTAVLCCAAGALSQQKYVQYHFTPVVGVSVVFGGWAAGEWLAAAGQPLIAAGAAAMLALAGATAFHLDVSADTDPIAVRLGRVVGGSPSLLVESVYLHGLCTPFKTAPRCIGPQAYTVRLPQMAKATDSSQRLEMWASSVASQVRQQRPDLIALSTGELAMPAGESPAVLSLERFPSVPTDQYVPLSKSATQFVQSQGWVILRRIDVPERYSR
jgi:hypothetical protein